MKKDKLDKGTHLSFEDRCYMEEALNQKCSLKEIAKNVGKDPTTVSKEIRRNRTAGNRYKQSEPLSCNNKKDCTKTNLCNSSCDKLCKKCKMINCYRSCSDYTAMKCVNLERFPHVCNGCKRLTACRMQKQHYRAKVADANYHELLKVSREGADITSHELDKLDDLISPLILKGQSITHIFANHKDEIDYSERTLYNYFDNNMFTARNIDLPRKVRYKPRKKSSSSDKRSAAHRLGRTYDDFNTFIEANPGISVVEMDTVYGTRGGKVLLTFFFRNCSLMIAFLLESCTIDCVTEVIDNLYEEVGAEVFKNSFPVILTDNGSEFKAPEIIEYDNSGNMRTRVFYCNPLASYQKPHIEKNHEYIRYILPKGRSFKNLNQEDVTLSMNHINSTARASLNGKPPYKLARLLLDESLLEKLSLREIPADEVHLKPSLLKK